MSELNYNSLIVNKVFAENIETNDGVKYLDENESIGKYGSGETILPYDWSPDYSNALQHFGVSGYTAQTSGWLSVDRAEKDVTSIFINDNITNTFYNDGSYQVFLTRGDSVTASSKIDITFAPTVSESGNVPTQITPYDIWEALPIVSNDGFISLKKMFIPNASLWNSKIYKSNNLSITKVENNKAYNGEEFVCNIQSEKIENGSRLFFNCPELLTFDSDLSSLSNGNLMFFNTKLDSLSVEKILTSIPTYTSGVHNLTMTIRESAVEKFSEIVGLDITDKINKINYKGWEITLLITDNREIPTDYDIWKDVIVITNNMNVTVSDLYIPDASGWNEEIYHQNNLKITKVENNKAYNHKKFICNIQTEEIVNGDNLFNGVLTLTSFTSPLSSLSSGDNMFNGCNLDIASVENILGSIPSYTSDTHVLRMAINSKAVDKFKEITNCGDLSEEPISVFYKGWTIDVSINVIKIEESDFDIWEGTPYIPDASNWRTDVYNKNNIRITDVKDNMIFNGEEFVCNIQCENIETDATLNLTNTTETTETPDMPDMPSLFSNTHLRSFEGDLSSLKIPFGTFASTNITNFDSDLSNVTFAPFGLFGDCFDLTEFNSDLPNLVMSEMGYQSIMIITENIPMPFPKPISFINTGLTSFGGDLSSLVCSNMFLYCDKLENFSSDISSLGDFSKLYEHPEIIDWLKTMGILPSDYVLPTIDLWETTELMLFALNYMFMGCNLNSSSVEHILNSLTSYDDGYERMLGMTINSSAVPTFTQITGATFTQNTCTVAFKGWYILCEIREEFVPTELDVLEGSPYCHDLKIMYAGDVESFEGLSNTFLYKLATSASGSGMPILRNNKIYTGSEEFVCNFQSDKIVSSIGLIGLFEEIFISGFPKLKYNMNIMGLPFETPYFSSDLRSLEVDMSGFSESNIDTFYSSLHSLVCSMGTFANCENLSLFFSDLRSLCFGEAMFGGCSNLTSFDAKLFSLGDVEKLGDVIYDFMLYVNQLPEGEEPPTKEEILVDMFGEITFGGDMFTGCNLDASSVENILTSIPEWNDEIYRELGMTIQSGDAATKFGEITGIIPASTEIIEVPFKGWNVKVNLFSV